MSAGDGKSGHMDAQVTTNGKRKSSSLDSTDSEGDISSAKIIIKDYALSKQSSSVPEKLIVSNDLVVVVSGRSRPMKHYHPTVVNKAIQLLIGNYDKIRLLPSGDLAVTCKRQTHVKALLDCDSLVHNSTTIPVKTSLYQAKSYGCRVVITGVPLEVTGSELEQSLATAHETTFLRRLKRKTDKGYVNSLSYLICFKAKTPPEFVNFGYLRFRTKQYNPPPQRCYKCNRYGHKQEKCRSKPCCCKCGSRDHEYKNCPRGEKRCVNCSGNHSAAYGGCSVYKQEAKLQVIKEKSNVSYSQAKEILAKRTIPTSTVNSSIPSSGTRMYSQVTQRNTQRDPLSQPALSPSQQRNQPLQQDKHGIARIENPLPDEFAYDAPANITVSPLQLIAFIAEVLQLAITAQSSKENNEVLNIISEAASKFLGFTIDQDTLKSFSNPPSNSVRD